MYSIVRGGRQTGGGGEGDNVRSHTQSVAASTWTVNHNLGRKPLVGPIRSVGGAAVGGDVLHLNDNQFQVSFVGAYAGSVEYI